MIRIGILGAAGIAPSSIIAPAKRRGDVRVVSVASRNPETAQKYAEQHGIARFFGTYDQLIISPDIDVVYVALPPSEHAKWSLAALDAGKHVLCEKPIAMNALEAAELAAKAHQTGLHLLEAFHDHYHPLQRFLREFRRSGQLGTITSIETAFTADNPYSPSSIRHEPLLGGGALMDLGCYPIHWLRKFMETEPTVNAASYAPGPLGADETIDAQLSFGATEVRLHASMSAGSPFAAPFHVKGLRGSLSVDNMVLPHRGHSVTTVIDGLSNTCTIGGSETYDYQLDALVHALNSDQPAETEGQDFVANMAVLDAIYMAAHYSTARGYSPPR